MAHLLSTLERFGARFARSDEEIQGSSGRFEATDLDVMRYSDRADLLNGPHVSGVTKTAMLAACTAVGPTTIANPYRKPDVMELARFLDGRVAAVEDDGRRIRIEPRGCIAALTPEPTRPFALLSDLSEVMTWITAAVLHGIELELELCEVDRVLAGLRAELELLEGMGIAFAMRGARLRIVPPPRIRSVDIEVTSVGIYSDHQPLFALLLLCGDRPARIRDCVWTERFGYADELCKLGARIERGPGQIVVFPSQLSAAHEPTLDAQDLRGAAALLLAATRMDHALCLRGAEHLVRGYEDLVGALCRLGARIDG